MVAELGKKAEQAWAGLAQASAACVFPVPFSLAGVFLLEQS